ncbi:MAG: 23S rRNA (pseudouridine(1915)-N(3))-methyltransferase RlmH [Candidatus Zixiibacteriota bacterium]
MLNIRIVAVGRHKDRWVGDGCAHFEKMLSRFAGIEWVIIPSPKSSSSLSVGEILEREAKRMLPQLDKGFSVALTDRGQSMDTAAFAGLLERWHTVSGGTISFVIGGPYGLSKSVVKKADFVLSLSSLTFSHRVVRLVLLEQLYRGFSILHGMDYHK